MTEPKAKTRPDQDFTIMFMAHGCKITSTTDTRITCVELDGKLLEVFTDTETNKPTSLMRAVQFARKHKHENREV